MSTELTSTEKHLLKWLGQEDFSQYGECHGKDLDSLIEKGLAQHHSNTGFANTFIAKGNGIMFDQVSLTDAGREALRALTATE